MGMYTSAGHLVNINLFYGFLSFLINSSSLRENHAMLPALDAILGHKSAHSLETGPVMAEPFISVAKTISPLAAAGSRFNRPRIPPTAIMYRFLAPVLSAQLNTAPTGSPREMRNFAPAEPPRPLFDIMDNRKKKEMK